MFWRNLAEMAVLASLIAWPTPGRAEDETTTGLPGKQSANPTPRGVFFGCFVFDGDPPRRQPIEGVNRDNYDKLGLLDESLLVGSNGGIQNIIVWISDKNLPIPPRAADKRIPAPAQLVFRGGLFQPRVLAYEAWHGLQVINQEPNPTNVNWQPLGDGAMNRLLPPNESVIVDTPPQRLPSLTISNIHPWARAALFPCEHPFFAVTDAKGEFRIDRIPPGEWEFRAWHERWGYIKFHPDGARQLRFKVQSGDNDLGIVRVRPAEGGDSAAEPPGERQPSRPNWPETRVRRIQSHNRELAARFVGGWKLTLPRGFQYDVKIEQREDGLLTFDCPTKINLLGTFAVNDGKLLLVESNRNDMWDFVWEERDGTLLLIGEEHADNGARYLGAKMVTANR
ncbi:MAG: hypothetical protein AB7I37_18130 [Pirellulales bacterium]